MRLKYSKFATFFLVVVLCAAVPGCNPFQKPLPPTPLGTSVETALPFLTAPVTTATASVVPTATFLPTQTPKVVTVAATKGNLFIRRGPDLGFNPIAVLREGQSARALSRDVLSNWLQIPIPDQPDKTGWVSIQTHYSVVSGDVMDLPEFTQTYWPAAASLRNCTHHQMQADPAGIVLPPVDQFPENEVQMNPGTYAIRDIDVDHSPVVAEVVLQEGSAIDIRTDGDGVRKKCPIP
jgi:hypothetical protein